MNELLINGSSIVQVTSEGLRLTSVLSCITTDIAYSLATALYAYYNAEVWTSSDQQFVMVISICI